MRRRERRLWNPVKIKLMQGGKVVGGTVAGVTDPQAYCAMANAGYDFTWTEMQHAPSVGTRSCARGRPARTRKPFPVCDRL